MTPAVRIQRVVDGQVVADETVTPAAPEPRYVLTERGRIALWQADLTAPFDPARSVAAVMPLPAG